MTDCRKYMWQWAMMCNPEGSVKDLGYYSLFTPEERESIGRYVAEKSTNAKGNDGKTDSVETALDMAELMKDYSRFIMPSLNGALHIGETVFITPYNATGRWSYSDRHGTVVVVADDTAYTDLTNRIKKSGMKLKSNIVICPADITDSASLQRLRDDNTSGLPVYFSLGLLPLTESCENTGRIINSIAQVMTPADNLAFGFISLAGSNLPRGTPVFTPADMESLLSCADFNVYEDGQSTAPDGTEITFFLAVKKLDRHK